MPKHRPADPPRTAGRPRRAAAGRIVVASQNAVTRWRWGSPATFPPARTPAQEAFLSAWHNLPRLKNTPASARCARSPATSRTTTCATAQPPARRRGGGTASSTPPTRPRPMPGADAERDAVAADLISPPEDSRESCRSIAKDRPKQVARQQACPTPPCASACRARQSVRDDLLTRFRVRAQQRARPRSASPRRSVNRPPPQGWARHQVAGQRPDEPRWLRRRRRGRPASGLVAALVQPRHRAGLCRQRGRTGIQRFVPLHFPASTVAIVAIHARQPRDSRPSSHCWR